ncbi:methylcrotonoyl-CoA carboxylase [Variovorax paradoxus]|uniref:carboxyl transferase domain-containing protein n=1 Tax=Comamonadaceae TaxID=80864 RepID=UPI000570A41E|nr:carboxyl transferase domain-containing protein [Xenophilus azovorans]KPU99492.1 methylcrotonoyl-CoA carboxylase [Variovorax paradoxus]MBN8751256.1 methylcrotonoyl-CoA carboxylase [Variovorax sp.]VTY39530.1 Methylmalonyl-CoA carboxyltransferase 12S subunit [Xylophilus ampelinus]KPV00390.1 methylcrotonoyl-CoA carboxylase [Variovorax paradoxus]KPV07762.1 methylcrotonoyl-CoA carboxylase [Variovorax paradoxus]
MSILASAITASPEELQANRVAYEARVADLRARRTAALAAGSAAARQQLRDGGQMLVRERISALLDPGSPFLELCQLAGEGLYGDDPPGAGVVTGVGMIAGRPCMVIASDPTVNDGAYNAHTCKRHVRAQRFAWQHRLPCVTMLQPGAQPPGARQGVFADEGQFGSILYNQTRMSREGIAQICSVHGPAADAAAFVAAMCDEVVVVRERGALAFGAAVPAPADAERANREDGVTDRLAESDAHAIAILRDLVGHLGDVPKQRRDVAEPREPLHDTREIYGLVSADPRVPTSNREIVLRLIDGSDLHEFKPEFGDTLITGFARIQGFDIGILCNNGVLFSESALKATQFIDLCCKRDIPLLFMADINGFMVGREAEEAGIAKHGAKMITAMTCANVPKYTLIIGGSYGAGYLAMCGRAFKPNAMMMWPNGRAAIMGPDQAATTLAMVKDDQHKRDGTSWTDAEREAYKAPVRKTFEDFANAYNFARNTWCDLIVEPAETRDVMAMLLDLAGRVPAVPSRFGVFRM